LPGAVRSPPLQREAAEIHREWRRDSPIDDARRAVVDHDLLQCDGHGPSAAVGALGRRARAHGAGGRQGEQGQGAPLVALEQDPWLLQRQLPDGDALGPLDIETCHGGPPGADHRPLAVADVHP
jgi:hypothetical protein